MAKHNIVNLYGVLLSPPTITYDEKEKKYTKGLCVLIVIGAEKDLRNFDKVKYYSYSCPVIMTQNEKHIEEMLKLHQWDIVEIKGTVSTKDVIKNSTCSHCGGVNKVHGKVVTIQPMYIGLRGFIEDMPEDSQDMSKIMEALKPHIEISNQATVIGTLCGDPELYMVKKGKKGGFLVTQYKLAVNRKYRVLEDPSDLKTDYPWIKAYGAIAESDAKALHQGSTVFIDGLIKTRSFTRSTVCEHCNEVYEWEDSTMEVTPYSVEYLRNFYTSEDSKQMEEEKADEFYNEVSIIRSENDIDQVNYGDVAKDDVVKEKTILERKISRKSEIENDENDVDEVDKAVVVKSETPMNKRPPKKESVPVYDENGNLVKRKRGRPKKTEQ